MKSSVAAEWGALEDYFQYHVRLVERFREANRDAVTRMWLSQTNECGKPLTLPECEALIERHSELFGIWPPNAPLTISGATGRILARLKVADRHIANGQQRIAEQRNRVAGKESAGHDTWLSKRVLESFEAALQLMIDHRDMLARELLGNAQR